MKAHFLDVFPSTQESNVISDLIRSHASSRLAMDSRKCTSELALVHRDR